MNHADQNHCLAGFGVSFVVFAMASAAAQPRERAFHDPSFAKHLEPSDSRGLRYQFDRETERSADEGGQAFAAVGAVGKDHFDPCHFFPQSVQHQARPAVVLLIGSMNDHCQNQAQGVDDEVSLATAHLFAGVVASFGAAHLRRLDALRGRLLCPGPLRAPFIAHGGGWGGRPSVCPRGTLVDGTVIFDDGVVVFDGCARCVSARRTCRCAW